MKAREVFGELPTHSSHLIEVCHYLHLHTKYSFVFITALHSFLVDVVLLLWNIALCSPKWARAVNIMLCFWCLFAGQHSLPFFFFFPSRKSNRSSYSRPLHLYLPDVAERPNEISGCKSPFFLIHYSLLSYSSQSFLSSWVKLVNRILRKPGFAECRWRGYFFQAHWKIKQVANCGEKCELAHLYLQNVLS